MERLSSLPSTGTSFRWTQASITSTVLFIGLLLLLHLVKPELDPSWRMISEYAIGDFGWLLSFAFFAWSFSFVALFMAFRNKLRNRAGKIGLTLLLVSAAGILIAGIFTTDPVTATHQQQTTSGHLHSIGGTMGLAIPFSALFLCISVVKDSTWAWNKSNIKIATAIAWIGFLVAMGLMIGLLSDTEGVITSATPVGYPNRFEVLCNCIWLIVLARQQPHSSKRHQ